MRPNIGAAVLGILLATPVVARPELVEGQEGRQAAPRAGAPLPILGAVLGSPVTFGNAVETTTCHPILMSDHVLAWIAALHVTEGMLLIQRCVELDPEVPHPSGTRHGGKNGWWEEAQLSAADESFITNRLRLPNWSESSNAAFCGHVVAYWGFRASELVPTLVDLRSSSVIASQSAGTMRHAGADRAALPTPAWSNNCAEATFEGAAGKPGIKLLPRR